MVEMEAMQVVFWSNWSKEGEKCSHSAVQRFLYSQAQTLPCCFHLLVGPIPFIRSESFMMQILHW